MFLLPFQSLSHPYEFLGYFYLYSTCLENDFTMLSRVVMDDTIIEDEIGLEEDEFVRFNL